jgi:hypothetical protein
MDRVHNRRVASEADWSPEMASKCTGLFSAAPPVCLQYHCGNASEAYG